MDAAEQQFGITIELENFIGVRTVQDIAQRISMVIARQGGAGLQPAAKFADHGPVEEGMPKSAKDVALKAAHIQPGHGRAGGLYSHGIEPGRVSPAALT
jgi:hypothetical protein